MSVRAPSAELRRCPVLLVGGGIGGLTAAIALARAGLTPIVLEQAEAFAEVGAGVQLAPNATRVLAALGLGPAIDTIGFAPVAAEVRDSADGALLLRTVLGAEAVARWGRPYLQVHRADLHAVLLEHARRLGVEVRTGVRVISVSQDGDGVRAATSAGSIDGAAAVGCDGIHSPLRSQLFGASAARFTGQVAWRALVEADRLPTGLIAPVAAVWTGPGRHLVHYMLRSGALVNVVGVVDGQAWSEESWSARGEPAAFAALFEGWPEPVTALLRATSACWRWAVHDRSPLARWSVGRVALLGDAAHPTVPFLAQGAGMAVEDACTLAAHLGSGAPTAQALAAYARARQTRTARVAAWARRNGHLFHLARPLRRVAFGLARRLNTGGDAAASLDWLYGETGETAAAMQQEASA